ncbi:MAG: hypothetical protein H0V83_10410 [Rubrobacter sp.]|nr:hypothetical protein [Rubrobacter sp.]
MLDRVVADGPQALTLVPDFDGRVIEERIMEVDEERAAARRKSESIYPQE